MRKYFRTASIIMLTLALAGCGDKNTGDKNIIDSIIEGKTTTEAGESITDEGSSEEKEGSETTEETAEETTEPDQFTIGPDEVTKEKWVCVESRSFDMDGTKHNKFNYTYNKYGDKVHSKGEQYDDNVAKYFYDTEYVNMSSSDYYIQKSISKDNGEPDGSYYLDCKPRDESFKVTIVNFEDYELTLQAYFRGEKLKLNNTYNDEKQDENGNVIYYTSGINKDGVYTPNQYTEKDYELIKYVEKDIVYDNPYAELVTVPKRIDYYDKNDKQQGYNICFLADCYVVELSYGMDSDKPQAAYMVRYNEDGNPELSSNLSSDGLNFDVYQGERFYYEDGVCVREDVYHSLRDSSDKVIASAVHTNENGRKVETNLVADGDIGQGFVKSTYDYDADGNLISETKYAKDGSVYAKETYEYDSEGRLSVQTKYKGESELELRAVYVY